MTSSTQFQPINYKIFYTRDFEKKGDYSGPLLQN